MKSTTIIALSDISYGYSLKSPILEGVNLNIRKGEFVGLLGPSGSGKDHTSQNYSWLDKTLAMGPIVLGNNSITAKKVTIGYVPQVESVDWNFPVTVKEVVAMGIWNQSGIAPWLAKNAKEQIDNVLKSLGIGKYVSRQIRESSGGEQQRVFLARALIRNPDLLVLDEPTSGVDHNTREKIIGNLNDLNIRGMTIIITTHDVDWKKASMGCMHKSSNNC